ncbi:TIGR04255 family protein [Janthinobacterium lividum]|jgi:uncharacterized protein (TIGR04255 family)|uniref:TIGR04255 family protein n=1 Tax=Janthinobacterium TaxID=29580 RepID=UPI000C0EF3E3|nr:MULTISPECIES: TIGR04255 family protein [Janthinobacterium]MBR7633909.1 TIGR04255 family protein [Janthinobacterium lividum]PHV47868.1 hypothetical protein CSQ91_23575 [Janthinobacterium sp. BJB301]QKY06755.1 TIGR04255 family protein [Janthinobacterium lividum]
MRPADLPDFGSPPLGEVVLGVQFSNPAGYSQIHAGKVWDLFQENYPHVEEYMPLPPVFETFGPQIPSPGNQLSFVDGALHDRYWFLNERRDEIIQFQQDRILHNWRKVGDRTNEYPRFEHMIARFTDELTKLENYFSTLTPQKLQISQCEISYINHIATSANGTLKLSDWLSFVNFGTKHPQNFNLNFRETIVDANEKPRARLICEIGEILRSDGQRAISLSLTVRGAPESSTISSALKFLAEGRTSIVNRFTELTTPEAHKAWERKK